MSVTTSILTSSVKIGHSPYVESRPAPPESFFEPLNIMALPIPKPGPWKDLQEVFLIGQYEVANLAVYSGQIRNVYSTIPIGSKILSL